MEHMNRDRAAGGTLLLLCVLVAMLSDGWPAVLAAVAAVMVAVTGLLREIRAHRAIH